MDAHSGLDDKVTDTWEMPVELSADCVMLSSYDCRSSDLITRKGIIVTKSDFYTNIIDLHSATIKDSGEWENEQKS